MRILFSQKSELRYSTFGESCAGKGEHFKTLVSKVIQATRLDKTKLKWEVADFFLFLIIRE